MKKELRHKLMDWAVVVLVMLSIFIAFKVTLDAMLKG